MLLKGIVIRSEGISLSHYGTPESFVISTPDTNMHSKQYYIL